MIINIMLAMSTFGMTKVSTVILIMSLVFFSSCLSDKAPRKESAITINGSDQSLVNESDPANNKISMMDTCYYFIKAKDTFYSLAEYYYGTDKEADELKKLNPEVDPKRLKIGQKIRVPCNPVQINQ